MTDETMTPEPDALVEATPQGGALIDPSAYEAFEGSGFENADTKDLQTPYIILLDDDSKQCKPDSGAHVPGAKGGMFLNTGTNELIPGNVGFAFVPLYVEHCVVEWNERQFVRRHEIDSPIWKKARADFEANPNPKKNLRKDVITEEGNQLSETYYVWCMMLDESGERPVGGFVLPFSSTGIKVYKKQLYSPLYTFKGAGGKLFVHRMRCKATPSKNDQGSWFSYQLTPLNGSLQESLIDPNGSLIKAAYAAYKEVATGMSKMQDPGRAASSAATETADEAFG